MDQILKAYNMSKWWRKVYLLLLLTITISASAPLKVASNIQLGEYHSIKDHPKAKGVNLKVKVPKGWKVEEGDRPNVVVKFVNGSDLFLVMVKDTETFISKKDAKELFEDQEFITELTGAYNSQFKQWTLLDKKVVTIDNYPALELVVSGSGERVGVKFEMVMKTWYFFYEDKFIYLQGGGIKSNTWAAKSQLYSLTANSVILPDQYN
jgi:hypothetical protein